VAEREALALSLEFHAERVILDDFPALRLAQPMGSRVIGTLGVLLAAKRLGLLETGFSGSRTRRTIKRARRVRRLVEL
jgi:predicted nucleic acid-binding protein